MSIIYVLVATAFFGSSDPQTATAEFNSYEACQQAGKDFLVFLSDKELNDLTDINVACIKSETL